MEELQPSAADDAAWAASLRADGNAITRRFGTFWLTRFVFLRALGFVYVVAFAVLWQQIVPLIGAHGLLPARLYLERVQHVLRFWQHPTLFYWGVSDTWLRATAALGLGLSILVLAGLDHAAVLWLLWALYISFVNIGQIFYGYGWESLLLETGALAVFLCPVRSWSSLRDHGPPPRVMFVWLSWLLFRVMFGAGLIKLRGDSCWRDLSCLFYHYETQPVPHALSRILHHAPHWFQRASVLFNHFVEVFAPLALFVPGRTRLAAVGCIVIFQITLILSGNLSFLNWLTIAVALGCVDDSVWRRCLPRRLVSRAEALALAPQQSRARMWSVIGYSCVVAVLSLQPLSNMLSARQVMNTSFEPLRLVNTYGAFGSVGRERDEIILEGTADPQPSAASTWLPYEFECKPGDVLRMPCWITPYHYRLDWQMWFAAMSQYEQEPWLLRLVHKLLQNDPAQRALLAHAPFTDAPPRYIRILRYRYHFSALGAQAYWSRELVGQYMPAVSLHDERLLFLLEQYGFDRDYSGGRWH